MAAAPAAASPRPKHDSVKRCTRTEQRGELPDAAVLSSLGCGNPTAVAELDPGETVLDLGSGGGIDVLLSARRVGPTGMVYGLDMTDEMLALAATQRRRGRRHQRRLPQRPIEAIPLPAESRRRGDLQLRHQPVRGQARCPGRDRPRAEAGWARRRSATSSRRTG